MFRRIFVAFSFLHLVISSSANTNNSVKGDSNSLLNDVELRLVHKLRPMVEKHLYKDYMNEDNYLVRFLRARRFNLNDARDMLMKSLEWRKHENIDGILEEKMEIEKAMPYHMTYDRVGRPAGFIKVGEWRVRRWLLARKHDEIVRAVYKLAEIAMLKIREASETTGTNITQGIGVLDLAGFNVREHTCILCMQLYIDMVGQYEKYYPQIAYKLIGINTPRIVISLYDTLKYVASKYTQDTVFIYGYDKSEWRSELLKHIDNDQIPTYLGGTFAGSFQYGHPKDVKQKQKVGV